MDRSLTRHATLTLLCGFALIASLVFASSAGAAGRAGDDEPALSVLGRTVWVAIATSPAVDSLSQSIAMLDARFRVQAQMSEEQSETSEAKTLEHYERHPSSIPPASAGSNGTEVPRAKRLQGEEIFAHTRASGDPNSTAILLTGVALAPPQAPEVVKGAINAANTIVGRPYVFGGGHGSFYSHGYDCSGSVSFALFGGGLIPRPLTSGELQHWGAPGRGEWITVYANPGHTFVEIAGLRWDTVGDEKGTGPRWHLPTSSTAGFVARHPPGY
jgi:cell wall-associated NlpC family hydrolase